MGTLGFVGAMALDQPMLVSGAMGGAMLLHLASGLDALRLPPAARLPGWGRALLGGLAIMALGLAGGQLNRRFLVETFRVPSGSMIPTLQVGDTVFARKTAFVPARGEVVVFRLPSNPSQSFIKRVAAVGGDRVQVCGSEVRINDEPLRRQLQADPAPTKTTTATAKVRRKRAASAAPPIANGTGRRAISLCSTKARARRRPPAPPPLRCRLGTSSSWAITAITATTVATGAACRRTCSSGGPGSSAGRPAQMACITTACTSGHMGRRRPPPSPERHRDQRLRIVATFDGRLRYLGALPCRTNACRCRGLS